MTGGSVRQLSQEEPAGSVPSSEGIIRRVKEYLIRTQAGHDWPAFPRGRLAEVLTPAGLDCRPVEGWGDLHLRCGDASIAFSGEDVGWQVTVDGLEDADAFVARVTEQVAEAAGEPCEWLRVC